MSASWQPSNHFCSSAPKPTICTDYDSLGHISIFDGTLPSSSNAATRIPAPAATSLLHLRRRFPSYLVISECELAHNDLKKVARQRSQLRYCGTVVALIAAFLHARGQDWRAPPNSFPFPLFQQARSLGVWFLMGGYCDTASRLKDREDGGWRAGGQESSLKVLEALTSSSPSLDEIDALV